ncbi:MAG TPA: TrbG/VirB9 family P-type conjugative transfer protein [Roseomonas sp.]|nr:TrbG/VirB9 family P-type conjugative transfer protein [Roseomonas sp.]
MSRISALAAMLAGLAATPVWAAQEPSPCSVGEDPRVRCITVTEDRVILLRIQPGTTALIELPPGERVVGTPASDNSLMLGAEAMARTGSTQANATTDGNLSVAVRGNTVALKPHHDLEPQPFFVLTEREGLPQQRYRFQLETAEAGQAFYSVRLRNLAAERARRKAHWRAQSAAREKAAAEAALRQAQAAPCAATPDANFRWIGIGDARLAPAEICDNGRQTFLRFPGVQRVPAIVTVLPDGTRAVANNTMNPQGWVVVHANPPQLLLADGQSTLCVINKGYDPVGRSTGTGTVSPDVVLAPKDAQS